MARGTSAIVKSCGNPRIFVCGHQCLFRVYLLWRRGLQGAAAARLLSTIPLEFWRLFCLAFADGQLVRALRRIVYQTPTAFGIGCCLSGGCLSFGVVVVVVVDVVVVVVTIVVVYIRCFALLVDAQPFVIPY